MFLDTLGKVNTEYNVLDIARYVRNNCYDGTIEISRLIYNDVPITIPEICNKKHDIWDLYCDDLYRNNDTCDGFTCIEQSKLDSAMALRAIHHN